MPFYYILSCNTITAIKSVKYVGDPPVLVELIGCAEIDAVVEKELGATHLKWSWNFGSDSLKYSW